MRPRLIASRLRRWVDPADAYLAVAGDADAAFWLDSGPSARTGFSYLGLADEVVTEFDGPVLDWLRSEFAEPVDTTAWPHGFALGVVGWLGYEVRGETMGVSVRRSRYPRAAWLRVSRALAFDHGARAVHLLSIGADDDWRAAVTDALAGPPPSRPARDPAPATARWAHSVQEYLAMIRECQAAIREGDAYQLCLTTEATVDANPDPVATYLAVRSSSPTHHGALLRAGEVSLVSASPEQFLRVTPGGLVETKPIKGTRPRGAGPGDDAARRDELLRSDKERAENLMIVDLMRNDLSRIAEVGSVEVTSLLAVESYAQVHQLVSTVRGRLADGIDRFDAIAACFPAGSMTGAPKRSATEILDRLEGRPRGIYSGAFGYLGFDGAVDLAMVIRSIVLDAHGATVGAGGGITALSVPQDELDEVHVKAAPLLRVLGAAGSG